VEGVTGESRKHQSRELKAEIKTKAEIGAHFASGVKFQLSAFTILKF
jgi:hypothetical protein